MAFKLLICLGSDAWVGSELRFKRIYQCSGYFWSCQPFEGFFFGEVKNPFPEGDLSYVKSRANPTSLRKLPLFVR